jgi:hypothetical protein
MLNALGMRFGEPVNKDAPSMKTVAHKSTQPKYGRLYQPKRIDH